MLGTTCRRLLVAVGVFALGGLAAGQGVIPPADNIHQAIRRNDVAAVRAMLTADASLVKKYGADDRQTPLHEASAYASPEMVQLVLEYGPDVNAVAYNGFTPLHLARSPATARLLVKAGANLAAVDTWGKTPLQDAVRSEELPVAETLIELGATIDLASALMLKKRDLAKKIISENPRAIHPTGRQADLWGSTTPLGLVARQGDLEMVQFLVKAGADVNAGTHMPNAGGEATPVSSAVWGGHAEVLKFLLENGAEPKGVGGKFYPSIFDYAVHHSEARIVELLLQHGAFEESDEEFRSFFGPPPLVVAAGNGDVAKVRLLLKHGANLIKSEERKRALLSAAYGHHVEVVALLKADGVPSDIFVDALLGDVEQIHKAVDADPAIVNARDKFRGRPLLVWAILARQHDTAVVLMEHGADLNSRTEPPEDNPRDSTIESPLLAAIGDPEGAMGEPDGPSRPPPDLRLVSALLEKGAHPNGGAESANTPMLWAIRRESPEALQQLLSLGADPNGRDEHGYTFLYWACDSKPMVDILLKHGADPTVELPRDASLIDKSILYDAPDAAEELLARGAKLTLFSACALGRAEFVLKEIQRDPRAVNAPLGEQRPAPPLVVAARYGHVELARLLLDAGANLEAHDPLRVYPRSESPLGSGAEGGHVPVARLLLDRGAKLDGPTQYGSALHTAAMHGQLPMVKFLVEQGAAVDAAAQESGWTPLEAAGSDADSADVAEYLIAKGANVNHQRSDSGGTPLQQAAMSGSLNVARVLLAHGADPSIRGTRGKTPLEWALWDNGSSSPEEQAKKAEVAKLLSEFVKPEGGSPRK